MTFRFFCPLQHEAGTYTVGDHWFKESPEFPQVLCVSCGKPCRLTRVQE